MKVLITGGTGFIGTHLVEKLSKDPSIDLHVIDRKPPAKKVDKTHYHLGDITTSTELTGLIQGTSLVFHLAALVSVTESQSFPDRSEKDTLDTTLKILEVVHSLPMSQRPRLVFSSTAAVYGHSVKSAQDAAIEDRIPSTFLSNYASHKFESEEAIRKMVDDHGLQASIFRLFNVFGPRQDPSSPYSGVISIFEKRIQDGKNLTIFGDGSQTRDFIHIDQIIQTLIKVMNSAKPEVWSGKAINVGTGKSTSIKELAEKMIREAGSSVKIEYAQARMGDVIYSRADITRFKKWLV